MPSLRPLMAKLTLPVAWTEEQIQSTLSAYGTKWNELQLSDNTVSYYYTPGGDKAIPIVHGLIIQSSVVNRAPAAAGRTPKVPENSRGVVPKF